MSVDLREFATPVSEPGKRINPPPGGVDLREFAEAVPGERPRPSPSFAQGVRTGTNQFAASMYGMADLAGSMLGSTTLREYAAAGLQKTQDDAEDLALGIDFSSIEDSGDFFDWASMAIGQQVPQLASMIGTGGIGGAIAKTTLKAALRKGLRSSALERLAPVYGTVGRRQLDLAVRNAMADPATQRLLRQSMSRGVGAGAAASSFALQAGDLQNQLRESGIDSPLTAIAGGAAAAALDAAPVALLLDRVFPGVDRALSKSFVQDIAKTMGLQAALEGGTEAAQEMVMLASRAFHDPSLDISSPANREQVLAAAAAGALVGGLTGGAGELAAFTPRAAARATREPQIIASNLSNFVKSRVEIARSMQSAAPETGGIGELRAAVGSFLEEQVAPVFAEASQKLQAGAQATKDALKVADIGLDVGALVTSLDDKVRTRVAPVLNQALDIVHRQVDAVRDQASQMAQSDRGQFLADSLSKIKTDIQTFIDKRIKPLVSGAEDDLAKEVGTANYDDPDLDADAYDSDETGDVEQEEVSFEETRIGPSGQPFKRTVVAEEPQTSVRTVDRDARVIDDPVRIRFGRTVEKTRTVRNKDGTTSTEEYRVRSRGDDAAPFGNRASAEQELAKIRENLPDVSEDAFVIEEAKGGGYVIGIQDAGQAEALWSQVKFNEALTEARISARMSKDDRRKIEIRKKGADGWTRIDLPSLVIAGKRLVEANGLTLPEHYGRAAQAGLDAALSQLIAARFEIRGLRGKHIDARGTTIPQLRKMAKEPTKDDLPTIDELREQNPGMPEEELVGLQEKMLELQKQREQLDRQEPLAGEDAQGATQEELGRETDEEQARQSARAVGRSDRPADQAELGARNERQVRISIENQEAAADIREYVERVAKLAGLGNRIAVVDKVGLKKLVEAGHPLADVLAKGQVRSEDRAWGWITAQNDDVVIYLRDDTIKDPIQRMVTLTHELGHLVEFVYFRQISDPNLREALYQDHAKYLEKGGQKIFEEWMADQFVSWIVRADKEPKTAVERFFHRVAIILRGIIAEVKKKFGLSQSYKQFADGIAAVAAQRGQDSNPYAQHFRNEGVVGRVYFKNPYVKLGDSSSSDAAAKVSRRREDEIPVSPTANFDVPEIKAGLKAKVNKILNDHPGAKQAGVRLLETMNWLHDNLTSSLNGQLRRMGFQAANELADIFNRTPGAERQNPTYFNNVQLYLAMFAKQFNLVLSEMTDADKAVALAVLQGGEELIPNTPAVEDVERIREIFEQFHDYLRTAGLPIKKIKNYFPRVWDTAKVEANLDKIVAKLEELGLDNEAATSTARKMAGLHTEAIEEVDVELPYEGFLEKRAKVLDDAWFQQFQSQDLDRTIERYLSAAVKRAEFNRFLGGKATKTGWNPRAKIDALISAAADQGATPAQQQKMLKAVDAMLGRHGRDDIPPGPRQVMAWIATYQNVRLLLFSTLAALPDIVGPAIRSNDFRTAFASLRNNWRELVNQSGDLTEMARTWGIISDTLNNHVLTEHFDNHWFPERARRINEKFFRAVGLERWTNFTRAAALAVGRDAIKRWAANGQAKELGELGLTVSDVQSWVDNGERTFGSTGFDSANDVDRKVAEALVQFVNESVMRPNPSQRPLWASNPAFMLLFHLKSFMYAFHDTVGRRIYKNFQDAGTPWQKAMVVAGPAAMMMALTAAGLELRELIQYKLWGKPAPTDSQASADYVWNLALRSGIFGVSQLAVDWENADERGQLGFVAMAGPTVQQVNDIIAKPLSQTVPKAIPVASQIPALRSAIRDMTPL